MTITATEANKITKVARIPPNPWDKLFCAIRSAANNGMSGIFFDEEDEGVYFKESRKEVKRKLEELGYKVTYKKLRNSDFYYDNGYHNNYMISWSEGE